MAILTPDEVRARVRALADPDEYDDAELVRLVAGFEETAEGYRGITLSADPVTQTFDYPGAVVMLDAIPVGSVTSVTVDGTVLDAAGYRIDREAGIIMLTTAAASAVVVVYVPAPVTSETLLRACAEYVRAVAYSDRSPQGRDVIVQTDGGGVVTRYSTPDREKGRPTGYLEVDRLLNDVADARFGHAVA